MFRNKSGKPWRRVMAKGDSVKILALSILILLYALVPILVFLILYVAFYNFFFLVSFLRTRDFTDGFKFMVTFLTLLGLIHLTLRLIKWIKKEDEQRAPTSTT